MQQSDHSENNGNDSVTRALTVNEARNAILKSVECTCATESVELINATGRVAAKDIQATTAIPPFTNSAMDGYAIRSQDIRSNHPFKVIGKSLAGHPYEGTINPGEAVRITTGAALPKGADAIVIQELVTVDGDTITTNAKVSAGQYIRKPGDDIQPETTLCAAKTKLGAAHIGLLAAQGISRLEVFAAPTVGVFSTGDELLNPPAKLAHGQIFDSNRATIRSALKNAGIESVDLGICADDEESIQSIMNSARQFDFLLSSGGVSVGEADYVKSALETNGALQFWKVAMKPGKPLVSGKLSGDTHFFGLPGNPVSSLVTCVQFVIPAIRAFCGIDYTAPPVLRARCLDRLKKEPGRFEFQRGIMSTSQDGELVVSTSGLQDSHVLSSMSAANCFICLDQFADGASIDETVKVLLFSALDGL